METIRFICIFAAMVIVVGGILDVIWALLQLLWIIVIRRP
jgi:hypothetical protein